jgi:hypothetical protein
MIYVLGPVDIGRMSQVVYWLDKDLNGSRTL